MVRPYCCDRSWTARITLNVFCGRGYERLIEVARACGAMEDFRGCERHKVRSRSSSEGDDYVFLNTIHRVFIVKSGLVVQEQGRMLKGKGSIC